MYAFGLGVPTGQVSSGKCFGIVSGFVMSNIEVSELSLEWLPQP